VRADAVAAVGGYRDAGWAEDYDLVLRLWAAGGRFRNVDALVRWREHARRHSRVSSTFAQDAFARCKVHHLRATLLRDRAVLVFGAGPVSKSFARELQAGGGEVAAFVDVDPNKLGKRIYNIPVVAIEEAPRCGAALGLGAVAGEEGRARGRAAAAAANIELVAVA
jgi:hypothetical protein